MAFKAVSHVGFKGFLVLVDGEAGRALARFVDGVLSNHVSARCRLEFTVVAAQLAVVADATTLLVASLTQKIHHVRKTS